MPMRLQPLQRAAADVVDRGASILGGLGIMPNNRRSFECPICCESRPEQARVVFARCATEDHGCCRACMSHYIRNLVADGRVNSIGCAYCSAPASTEELYPLMDIETRGKYERFKLMKEDPTMRECPTCGQFCPRVEDEEGNTVADMKCIKCGAEFCYFHSNAHVGRPCHDYEHDITQQDMSAMKDTQVCPTCGIRTEKDGGCNHMTCKKCGQEWCWTCGAEYGTCDCNPLGNGEINYRCLLVIVILILPVVLIFMIVSFLCALTMVVYVPLFAILTFPCTCDCRIAFFAATTFALMPLWVMQVAWMVIVSPVACCIGCCTGDWLAIGVLLFTPILVPLSCVNMCILEPLRGEPDDEEDEDPEDGFEARRRRRRRRGPF